jgi:predicted O-methyltransferase YrrM
MTPEEINAKLIIPEADAISPIKTNEAAFIYSFLLEKKLATTLETGFAYAKSASHIIAATQSQHIAIDPFQENYQSLGLKNIESLGFKKHLTFFPDYSHNVLPKLAKENRQFEFIFIDGDHKFDGEFIDFYYADMLLKKEGYILLHDTWMRSTRMVMAFIASNRKDYKQIKTSLRNFALYQKVGDDKRNGMHFREFYTFKSLISHNVIMWLTTGKSTPLKKLVHRIKEKLK